MGYNFAIGNLNERIYVNAYFLESCELANFKVYNFVLKPSKITSN